MGYEKGSGTAWTVHLLRLEHGSNPFTQAKRQMSRPLILTILPLYFPCQSVYNSQPSNTELLIILPRPHTTLPFQATWLAWQTPILSLLSYPTHDLI